MTATVIATTRSGSRYVILIEADGVRWTRVPVAARAEPMVGWLPGPPRIVHGERLMLGSLQSTPVTRVAFLPGPEPPAVPSPRLAERPEPGAFRSLFVANRH